jgi:dTDP-4-amino-4,6-dideoxygalactose transaminase
MKTIPYRNLGALFREHQSKLNDFFNNVFECGNVFFGEETTKLEKKLKEISSRKFAITVGSGADSIYFCLASLNLDPEDEVIVTSFSHMSSASSILRAGAKVKFVDIDSSHLMSTPEHILREITPRTKAIVAVHMFGLSLDLSTLRRVCDKKNIFLLEDCAQSFTADQSSICSGRFGHASITSFDPLKVYPSFGHGGAILTDSEELFHFSERLRHHGRGAKASNSYDIVGHNSKMSSLDSKIVHYFLNLHQELLNRRRFLAERYSSNLSTVEGITLPLSELNHENLWAKYCIRIRQDRDQLLRHLREKNIGAKIVWPRPLYREKPFATNIRLNNTEDVCDQILALPFGPELEVESVDFICECIKSFSFNHSLT